MQGTVTLPQLLADLVSFKTVTGDNLAAADCMDYLEDFLAQRGMNITRLASNDVPSMVATTRSTKKPRLLLQAHLDVVPCSNSLYQLQEDEGKFIGRGSFDMKFAGAVFLKLVDELKHNLADYDFGIMFTFDEEIGGQNGVGALLSMGYSAEVCILPDAGDNWQIEITQKGVWIVRLKATGVSVHGSRPWEGDNAIHRLLLSLQEISLLFDAQHAKTDTLSINKIQGGSAVNQVADQADAVLDIRFLSEENFKRLSQKIEIIAGKHRIDIETTACIKPVKTDLENPFVASFLKMAEQIHGRPLGHMSSLGNSDAHYFGERGIPVILSRPDGGAAHSNVEWIDKSSLEKYYQLIKAYVETEARLKQ